MNEPREKPLRVEPQESALDWAHATGATAPLLKELQVRSERRHRRRRSAWVGAAVALVAVGLFWNIRSPLSSVAPHESKPGLVLQPAQRHLPDGTVVDLREGSELTSVFSNSERSVVLSGEAHFSVAKDAARPFVVRAGGVAVRAVGTAFNVLRHDGRITVTVERGKVDVRAEGPRGNVRLGAGDQYAAREGGQAYQVAKIDPAVISAWRSGRAVYTNATLSEVASDLSRYYGRPIVVNDAETGALRFSGILKIENQMTTLRRLEALLPVVVVENANEVRLQRGTSK